MSFPGRYHRHPVYHRLRVGQDGTWDEKDLMNVMTIADFMIIVVIVIPCSRTAIVACRLKPYRRAFSELVFVKALCPRGAVDSG